MPYRTYNLDRLLLPVTSLPRERSNCVAQKVQTLYIDDIDGSEAAGTVRFGLDGTDYEIDLNAAHTDELHATLGTYIDPGSKHKLMPHTPASSGPACSKFRRLSPRMP